MKWTKHPTNASTSDPIINRAQEKFGIAGYAMCFKLIEVIGSFLEHKEQPPIVKLSQRTWAKHLMCRPQKLLEFLKVLQEEGHISFEVCDDFVEITMPSIRESLDNKAVSSALRAPIGLLEEKALDSDHIEIKKEDESVCFLTGEQFDRIKASIAKSGKDAIESTGHEVFELFRLVGESPKDLRKIEALIEQQFQGSEKSRSLGQSVVTAVKRSYKKAVRLKSDEDAAKKKAEQQKAAAEKERHSPNKTDPRCIKVLRQLEYDAHLEIHEMSIDRNELEYFITKNRSHHGDGFVKRNYGGIISFLESPPPQIIDTTVTKNLTAPQPITEDEIDALFRDPHYVPTEYGNDDDDDDDDDYDIVTLH